MSLYSNYECIRTFINYTVAKTTGVPRYPSSFLNDEDTVLSVQSYDWFGGYKDTWEFRDNIFKKLGFEFALPLRKAITHIDKESSQIYKLLNPEVSVMTVISCLGYLQRAKVFE